MVLLSLILSLATSALAALPTVKGRCVEAVAGAFLFELNDGYGQDALDKFIGVVGTKRTGLNYKLFKAISIQMKDTKNADRMAAIVAQDAAVKDFYPVCRYRRAEQKDAWSDVGPTAAHLTDMQKHIMHRMGYTGQGVRIAMVDSGANFTHQDLGGCYGLGCRIAFGRDMVGNFTGTGVPKPSDDPPMDDAYSHGTHIAGILIAQPNHLGFVGVVPDATLGVYSVTGPSGISGGTETYIAAFLQAYEDDADVITSSSGAPGAWPEDPWAIVTGRIVEAGVPCIVAAGNDGSAGLFYPDKPGNGKGVVSAAIFQNTVIPQIRYKVKYSIGSGEDVDFGYMPGDPYNWDGVTLDVYATSTDMTVEGDACSKLPEDTPDLSEKIVLIRYSTCCANILATNAVAKGAKYIILYDVKPSVTLDLNDVPGVLACAMAPRETVKIWIEAINSGKKVTLKMASHEKTTSYVENLPNIANGGALATMTSWGPSAEMELEPQFGAPGGHILSTNTLGRYSVRSGTSFSAPLIAGIIALIGQVRGTFDPILMNNLLSSTAKAQLFNDGEKFYDYLAPPVQQGSGLVQAYDAAFTTTLLEPASLSFNDTDNFVRSLNITIRNKSDRQVTYNISHVPTVTMYTLDPRSNKVAGFPSEAVRAAARIQFSQDTVTIGPGHTAIVEVRPTAPSGLDAKRLALWSGWVTVNGTDNTDLSVPYIGLDGSLKNTTVLARDDTWIARSNDAKRATVPADTVFTVPGPHQITTGAVMPALIANLTIGTPIGQPYGFPKQYRTHTLEVKHDWDGRLNSGEYAPEGRYKLVVRALRIFGNGANKADWDVSETAPFHIKYRKGS
ncbi:hypothetical protein DCS_02605 [Drechmeria coniospora]|uniref:Subtilisin-like serine protease PR1C n=1 Tax=Drechmeria coniospora TaxID=98403 RepID=A0A151GWP1_DRECN|nr:hypothetical protein DCS_02605 [Drechmeria coniospora]KYK61463.1 hypothetical protein DCS_02605 [Drechmeria coniospora]